MLEPTKATAILKEMSLDALIDAWNETCKRTTEQAVFDVRGWIMDEFERRNPAAYYDWIMSAEDSPEPYYKEAAND